MSSLSRQLDRILNFMAWLAIAIVLFSTLMVTADVIARELFHRGFLGVVELSEYGLIFVTFLGSAWLLREKGHVRVEVLIERTSPKVRAVLELIGTFIGMFSTALITYYSILVTMDFYLRGVRTPTVLEVPRAILFIAIPIGCFFLTLQFARDFIGWIQKMKANA